MLVAVAGLAPALLHILVLFCNVPLSGRVFSPRRTAKVISRLSKGNPDLPLNIQEKLLTWASFFQWQSLRWWRYSTGCR